MITRVVNSALLLATPLFWVITSIRKQCSRHEYSFQRAEGLLKNKKFPLAISILESLAANGYAKAQTKLGDCHFLGMGVTQDVKAATILWQRAYNNGDFVAQLKLAKYYLASSVKEDRQNAIGLLEALPLDKKNKQIYSIHAKLLLAIYYLEVKNLQRAKALIEQVNIFDSGADAFYRRGVCGFILIHYRLTSSDSADKIDVSRAEREAIANIQHASQANDRAKLLLAMLYLYGSKFGSIKPNRDSAKLLLMDLTHKAMPRFYLSYLLRKDDPEYAASLLAIFSQKNWRMPVNDIGLPEDVEEEWVSINFKDFVVVPTLTFKEGLIAYGEKIQAMSAQQEMTSHAVVQASLEEELIFPDVDNIIAVEPMKPSASIVELVDMIVNHMKQVVLQEEKDFKMNTDISQLVSLVEESEVKDFYAQDEKATGSIFANIQQMFIAAPWKSFQLLKQFKPMLALFCPDLFELLEIKKQRKGEIRIAFLTQQLAEIENCPIGERFQRAAVCLLVVLAEASPEKDMLQILAESPAMRAIGFSNDDNYLYGYCEEYAEKLWSAFERPCNTRGVNSAELRP